MAEPIGMALSVAATTIDVSPRHPVAMGGGEHTRPTARVDAPLEANIMLFRQAHRGAVLITIDALYVGPGLRRDVEAGLSGLVDPEMLFMAASHCHSAPMLDTTKPRLGAVDAQHVQRISREVVAATRRLFSSPGPACTLHAASYRSVVAMNRRRPRLVSYSRAYGVRFRDVVVGPDEHGTTPTIGHVVEVRSAEGVVGFIWHLACHPTSLPAGWGHHPHFPGHVRDLLRRSTGQQVPVLFLQGFSGDLRPPIRRRISSAQQVVHRVCQGPQFGPFAPAGFEDWCATVASEVNRARRSARPVTGRLDGRRRARPMSDFVSGPGVSDRQFHVHRLDLGRFRVIGVSAEAVYGHTTFTGPPMDGWCAPVGCIDDVFGYAPTAQMIEEGGYEAGDYCELFGLTGLAPGLARNFTDELRWASRG